MTGLKAFDITVAEEGYCEGIVKYRRAVYDKSEADEVITHHKYKRCLAMAKLCHWKAAIFIYKKEKNDFYWRWYERWLELAKKIKE